MKTFIDNGYSIELTPDFSSLTGYRIPVKFPDEAITSYYDFLKRARLASGKFKPSYQKPDRLLCALSTMVFGEINKNIDPLVIMHFLYYELRYSSADINSICGVGYTDDGIRALISKCFGWPLRDNNESESELRKAKNGKGVSKPNKKQQEEKEKNVKRIMEVLDGEKGGECNIEFNKDYFEKLKNKYEKMKYLIGLFGLISENNFDRVITEVAEKNGVKPTTEALDRKVEEITTKLCIDKIIIRPVDVRNIRDKYNSNHPNTPPSN